MYGTLRLRNLGILLGLAGALFLSTCSSGGSGKKKKKFVFITKSLPNATEVEPYSVFMTAKGGKKPYSWAITAGSLPGGLNLDVATTLNS